MSFNYRDIQLIDDESVGDSGTKTIDLNVTDPITALFVRMKVRNDTAAVPDHPPERHITKIEIVDGGTTHWSLAGQMGVAVASYGIGKWVPHWYDEWATQNQHITIPLMFGRHIGDDGFAFNPKKLLNPQLKVTWEDQALYDDGYHTLGVTARVMEGLSPPAQALMWKELEAWTTAATGEHKVDFPVDRPIRAWAGRAWGTMDVIPTFWSNYKLDCDLGKFIPFDLPYSELVDILKPLYGPFSLRKFDWVSGGNYRQAWMGETLNVIANTGPAIWIVGASSNGWSFYTLNVLKHDGTSVDDARIQSTPVGYFPHSTLLYPFGRQDDPETWFQAQRFGEVTLKITEAASGGAASVAVQQPVTL
jgi:hypothetical protein